MTDEYIPRKDLESMDADAIRRRINHETHDGIHTYRPCTTTGCSEWSRAGVCAGCLTQELKARMKP